MMKLASNIPHLIHRGKLADINQPLLTSAGLVHSVVRVEDLGLHHGRLCLLLGGFRLRGSGHRVNPHLVVDESL